MFIVNFVDAISHGIVNLVEKRGFIILTRGNGTK